jgi:hypothetical protein
MLRLREPKRLTNRRRQIRRLVLSVYGVTVLLCWSGVESSQHRNSI